VDQKVGLNAAEIANKIKVKIDPDHLARVLRVLCAEHVFTETSEVSPDPSLTNTTLMIDRRTSLRTSTGLLSLSQTLTDAWYTQPSLPRSYEPQWKP
jgi:hypothetical protein